MPSESTLGIYIHVPFCVRKCPYCDFYSVPQTAERMEQYGTALCRFLRQMQTDLPVDTIYFGGGTPTSISAEALEQLLQTVVRVFDLSKVREFCVEAGRPDTITREKLEVLKRYGVDRISVNPQTMEDAVLQQIGRKHTSAQIAEAFQLAREVDFTNINMVLIDRTQKRDMTNALLMDALANTAIEQVCDKAEQRIQETMPNRYFTWRFSPGYGDFPISEQPNLLAHLNAARQVGIITTETYLMNPRKSVSAIFGCAQHPLPKRRQGCSICKMRETCAFRKKGAHCGGTT